MIVRDIMTTELITIEPDDTVSHAAHLFCQYQFHHLPVVRDVRGSHSLQVVPPGQQPTLIFQGLLTTQDVETAVTLAEAEASHNPLAHPWQEQHVAEIMQHPQVWVTPTTSVAAAAQLLVERGINCLPVIEPRRIGDQSQNLLVGLLTRSDILLALARVLGSFEPGTQISIQLPTGHVTPLARALLAADELHVSIGSVVATPQEQHTPRQAWLRLSTINPAPLLTRLKQEDIEYFIGDTSMEGEHHA
ncbi:MAG: CBS domain-containing protein [Chloroflexi bacterium]|nr:MAG: CBS domain-containing protein [Chloroflexota bacterium]